MRSTMWLGSNPVELDIFHEVSEACMYSTCIYTQETLWASWEDFLPVLSKNMGINRFRSRNKITNSMRQL